MLFTRPHFAQGFEGRVLRQVRQAHCKQAQGKQTNYGFFKLTFAVGFLFLLFAFFLPEKAFASVVLSGCFTEAEAKEGGQKRKVVFANSNWYAFYNDASTVFYKKSSDGSTWGDAVTIDSTNSPFAPTAWVEGTTIYVGWLRDTGDTINVNTINTASSDNLGTQCTSTDLGTFATTNATDFVSLAVADSGVVYAAVGGASTAVVVKLTFSGCSFSTITTGSGLTTNDVPAMTTIGNNLHMAFSGGELLNAVYDGTN